MLKYASGMLSLHSPHFIYDSTKEGERNRLIDNLWAGEYQSAAGQFSKANPQLVSFFEAQFLDGQEPGRMLQLKASISFRGRHGGAFQGTVKQAGHTGSSNAGHPAITFSRPQDSWYGMDIWNIWIGLMELPLG